MSQKRTIDTFFQPRNKAPRLSESLSAAEDAASGTSLSLPISVPTAESDVSDTLPPTRHGTYPFPIEHLPRDLIEELEKGSATPGIILDQEADLDVVHYTPFIQRAAADRLFVFLRHALPFYRVRYGIKRGNVETQINTPRYTTVFGVDDSSMFTEQGTLVAAASQQPLSSNHYTCRPRPIPACLDVLRILTEAITGTTYNFALVNFYADGNDSISYHSDDEKFLGPNPTIASFSLGGARDFCLKHKPKPGSGLGSEKTLKMSLKSGEMVLMRGSTQACWLHSIPKRKASGLSSDKCAGRINITFRKALVRGGTENYYRYNIGDGEVFQWNSSEKRMTPVGCA